MNFKIILTFFLLFYTKSIVQAQNTDDNIDYNDIILTEQLNTKELALVELANDGNKEAQVVLAGALISGSKMKPDAMLAAKIYQNVINNQPSKSIQDSYYIEACFRLAQMFEKGKDLKQDFVNSAFLYKIAASQGHIESLKKLTELYHQGKGVERDDYMYLILMRAQLALAKLNVANLKVEKLTKLKDKLSKK